MDDKSLELDKLFAALAAMQSEIKGASASSENPFFNSKYADLESVWSAIRQPLAKNNLCIAQTFSPHENGVLIKTILGHASGQWLSSSLLLRPTKADPQGFGSAISYGRRYSLAAITGVYQVDDDGNMASEAPNQQSNLPVSGGQTKTPQANPVQPRPPFAGNVKALSDAQVKRLFAIGKANQWTEVDFKDVARANWNQDHLHLLSRAEYEQLCDIAGKMTYEQWIAGSKSFKDLP